MTEITEERSGSKGRFVWRSADGEAEMTYSVVSDVLRIVDHTEVPRSMGGQGVGLKLVEHLVADARAKGYRVVPLCPFVNRMRARHPEWVDIFEV